MFGDSLSDDGRGANPVRPAFGLIALRSCRCLQGQIGPDLSRDTLPDMEALVVAG